ncbi:MAG: PaaI family thioesterase [Clostridiales bacterium]|nr:PaaI family thioesterase [Clostridiales bacterium]
MNQDKQKLFEQRLAQIPFAKEFDYRLEEMHRGRLCCKVYAGGHLRNLYGNIHGGALYTIADTIAGIVVDTCGYLGTTVQGEIQYLKAAKDTSYVICEAETVKEGKNIFVISARIYDERGLLLDTATFTYFVVREQKETEVLD